MKLEEIGKKEFIGKGQCGKVYRLQDGNVFKKFNNPECISDIDRFKYFLQYGNDSFMFPFDFVYDDIKFYGHISKFALGEKFIDAFYKSNILDMSKNIIKLENDIKRISEAKILMFDFHDENLLYDGSKFSVIDVDEYSCGYIYTVPEVLFKNKLKLKNIILFLCNEYYPLRNKTMLTKIQNYSHLSPTCSELLYNLKETLDKYYKEDIKCLDDIKKISR